MVINLDNEASLPRRNYWSLFSLVLGVLGFLLALTAPIPFIPLISIFTWPLGLGALAAGWAGGRLARTTDDGAAAAQARWGIRLGCLGWAIQLATSAVKVLIAIGVLTYLFSMFVNNLFQPTPTAAP